MLLSHCRIVSFAAWTLVFEAAVFSLTSAPLAAAPVATTTTLSVSPNPSTLGSVVTLSAAVSAGASGTVAFFDNGSPLGTATLTNGQAALVAALWSSGRRSLTATYLGDATHAGSSAVQFQTVTVTPSTSFVPGVRFVPTGAGPQSIAAADFNRGGKLDLTLQARYLGNASYGPSSSTTVSQAISPEASTGLTPGNRYTVDLGPIWIVSADFNGDGKPDLVTLNTGNLNDSISVLLSNGDGSFRAPTTYTPFGGHTGANSMVAADFNGDGKPDLAIACNSGIYLLAGNGAGAFQAPGLVLQVGVSAPRFTNLAYADVNGDGFQDLLALQGGSVVVFLGSGDGTFRSPVSAPGGGSYTSFAVADMNRDGRPDLIAANYSGASVFPGNGDGTFQPPVHGPNTSGGSLAVGDFNGDGLPDVFLSGIGVQLGNGDGTLRPTIALVPTSFMSGPALAADFNGDGKLDIAQGGAAIALGNGDGTFPFLQGLSTDGDPVYVVMGDFNGDGRPDLAVVSGAFSTVDILLGASVSGLSISVTHSGNFKIGQTGEYQITIENQLLSAPSTLSITDTLPPGLTATAIAGGGASCTLSPLACTAYPGGIGENYPQIIITVAVSAAVSPSSVSNSASVSAGGVVNTASDLTLLVQPTSTTLAVSPSPSTLAQQVTLLATVSPGASGSVAFFDNGSPLGTAAVAGGQARLVATLWSSGRRSLTATYIGDSTHGASSAAQTQTVNSVPASGFAAPLTFGTGSGPSAIATADFNRDGKLDLVTANSSANTVSVLLGNGDGTFQAKADYATGTTPVAVITGDFNGDGKIDLAVADQASYGVSILLGNGDGTFQPAIDTFLDASPSALAVGDFNGDGRTDLVVQASNPAVLNRTELLLLFGNGDGTFRNSPPSGSFNLIPAGRGPVVADVNHDGKADLIYTSANVLALLGNGDGTFHTSFTSNNTSEDGLTVADLDGDGNPDIVYVNSAGVNVLLGNGDGTFRPAKQIAGSLVPAAIACADVNGDGLPDVITTNGSAVSVFLGNGDGTLQPPITYAGAPGGAAMVAGDFNGDGRTDLAITNSAGSELTVLLGVLTPVLSISSSHIGAFTLGGLANYLITVTNLGPSATSGTVTFTDTLPTGLTYYSLSGSGWVCSPSLTCTRSDSLAAGASYPVLTLSVGVAQDAPASIINQVNVSGGGGVGASASDPTAIVAGVPVTIQASPSGAYFYVDGFMFFPTTRYLAPGPHTISVPTPEPALSTGTQYVFVSWSDGGAASHTITVPPSGGTYTVTMKTQYQLTTSASPASGGTILPVSGQYFDALTYVPINITANPGWFFSFWAGDVNSLSNAPAIWMNSPHTLTANFNNACLALSVVNVSLPATGTSTPVSCPDASQPSCGYFPETPASLMVTPSGACGNWTATSSNPGFVQVVSGSTSSGAGSVTYSMLTNPHTMPRNSVITVTSGEASSSCLVTQAGNPDNLVYREVFALYQQLLGRDPDQSGFTFWVGVSSVGLGQMADDFLTSSEAFDTEFAVMAAYQAALGTPPTYAQFSAALAALRSGTQTVNGLFTSLMPLSYVPTTLYQNLLGRQPTGAETSSFFSVGPASWFQTLIGYPGTASPVSVPNNEFQSTGAFTTDHTNALYIRMLYFLVLGRDPDTSGFNFWLGIANGGGPGLLFQGNAGMNGRLSILGLGTPNEGFIGSPEFQGLFAN